MIEGLSVANSFLLAVVTLEFLMPVVKGADNQVGLRTASAGTFPQVQSDSNDEWRFQTSGDLVTWTDAPALGSVFSGAESQRSEALLSAESPQRFYRAVKTTGSFDTNLLRTISLDFRLGNWQTLLANGCNTESVCTPTMDNASFKVSKAGEEILPIGTDSKLNAVLDSIGFGVQETDLSYRGWPTDPNTLVILQPTPGRQNTSP